MRHSWCVVICKYNYCGILSRSVLSSIMFTTLDNVWQLIYKNKEEQWTKNGTLRNPQGTFSYGGKADSTWTHWYLSER